MKEEISEYYYTKGFDKVYVSINKEPRRVAVLHAVNGKNLTISYAKYLYTSFYHTDIDSGYEIDHINNNKLDDRIENLQILKKIDNIRKSHKPKALVSLVCPYCGKVFTYELRNLKFHNNPCCSKSCARRLYRDNRPEELKKQLTQKKKAVVNKDTITIMHDSGKTYGQIAKELGISLATLKRRMCEKDNQ